jgi:hypothetical protein
MPPDAALLRFVRGLLSGGVATRRGSDFVLPDGRKAPADTVLGLLAAGAVAGDARTCRAGALTRDWVRRVRLDGEALRARHRTLVPGPDGAALNLAESPLLRLGGFLDRHHVEAGERVRRLVERARLQPRLTMSYSAARTAGTRRQTVGDISDMAADARRAIADIHRLLPRDCAGVVLDVCGLLKGLQEVERERGWPRRSAKLVLRIGLDRLADHYGLAPLAIGRDEARLRGWLGEGARPDILG